MEAQSMATGTLLDCDTETDRERELYRAAADADGSASERSRENEARLETALLGAHETNIWLRCSAILMNSA